MAIDKTKKYWFGSDAADIPEYLTAYTEEGYVATEFRSARCSCGSDAFHLAADADEGAAKRTCAVCDSSHFICDSEEIWAEASPRKWKCIGKCKSKTVNICVGFALRANREDLHWVYVGVRCSQCGVLGCFADWKIDCSPSLHLMESE